jgi:UDP-N-acetylglucosamine--N-acetylmuramyl-(pentapeptide) pyrophosphoryl-undecaprenol N-acetylglucosamine transferase
VLQEQNSIPGATNRFLANFAAEVHLNFAASRKHLRRKDNLRLTGNPVRATVGAGNRTLALEHFGLDPAKRTVFVFGGSRGAHAINEATVGAIKELGRRNDVQFIVQTGKRDHAEVKANLEGASVPVAARPYLMRIEEAYAAADLIVCRSGAMTLSEVMACGLPAVLVPFPHAAQGHQVANAREMVEAGAAEMILDEELTGPRLARTIAALLDDPRRQREMSANAYRMARIDATGKLASALEALAGRRAKAAEQAAEREAPPPVPPPSRPVPPPRSGDRHRRRGGRGRGGRRRPNPDATGGAPRGGPQPKDRGPRAADARGRGAPHAMPVAEQRGSRAALGGDGPAR